MRTSQGRRGLTGREVCLNRSLYIGKLASRTSHSQLVARPRNPGLRQCHAKACVLRLVGMVSIPYFQWYTSMTYLRQASTRDLFVWSPPTTMVHFDGVLDVTVFRTRSRIS